MRILIVHNFYRQDGGEDAVVAREMAMLRARGHDVALFGADNKDIETAWRKARVALSVIHNPRARDALRGRIVEFRPDIVHVHNFFPQLTPAVFDACRAEHAPSVMTLHNFRILCPTATLFHGGGICERSLSGRSWWTVPARVYRGSLFGGAALAGMVEWHKWRRTWNTKVDRFIALTEFARNKFVSAGLPGERISVKPHTTGPPAGAGVPAEARLGALFVGRLSPEKGLAVLLEAWRGLDCPLRVAGDGPLRGSLPSPGPRAVLLGRLSPRQVLDEMRRAAFLVVPSVCYEMFPAVLVEAFAAGLPVIVSRLGGLAEIVEDGVTGLHFAPGDAADLARKVRWAADNPDAMSKMGENARAVYAAKFAEDTNHAQLMDIYRLTIRSARPAAGAA